MRFGQSQILAGIKGTQMSKKRSSVKSTAESHEISQPKVAQTQHEIEPSEAEKQGFERLIFFSDAVFAIAITVLVLEIHLPEKASEMNNAELFSALIGLFPQYLAYVISFLVIGSLWMNHHRKFRLIQHYNRQLIFLNLISLMVIAFIPFPTLVLSESGNRTATIFYAITFVIAGSVSLAVTLYIINHRSQLAPQADPSQLRIQLLRGLITPTTFLVSIGLAFINENMARLSWILILPFMMLIHRSD
jgi:uncharacterized membrane protein